MSMEGGGQKLQWGPGVWLREGLGVCHVKWRGGGQLQADKSKDKHPQVIESGVLRT